MIRAILTAHLSEGDGEQITLFLNKRASGAFAKDLGLSCVVPAMQKMHLMARFGSLTPLSKASYAAIENAWRELNRLAQIKDVVQVAPLLKEMDLPCDSLLLADEKLCFIWQARTQAVYLYRQYELYRLQPISPIDALFWPQASHLDLYAFQPQPKDLLFFADLDFVSSFDAKFLEQELQESNSFQTTMERLIRQVQTYERDYDSSWSAIEFKQIEANTVHLSNQDDSAFYDPKRAKRRQRELANIERSRASRVIFGQKLLIPERSPQRELIPDLPEHKPQTYRRRAERPSLNYTRQKKRQRPMTKEQVKQAELYANRKLSLERFDAPQNRREQIERKIQNFSLEPYKRRLGRKLSDVLGNIVSNRNSLLIAILSLVLLFSILLIYFFWPARDGEEQDLSASEVLITSTAEEIATGLQPVPPAQMDLEIRHILKSNNLQVRQKPDAGSPLIATAQRGDRILQLSEVVDDWVYVRLEDSGTEGYVYAAYLIEGDQ